MRHANAKEDCRPILIWILWICLVLFAIRITGQILVEFFEVSFLPPSKEWFSGIIPYPILLVFQIAIILLMAQVATGLTKGAGRFSHSSPVTAKTLHIFGSIYMLSMILRYIIRMYIYPEERWTGGCIPIVFHCVLATFVLAWGHWKKVSEGLEPKEK